MSVVSEIKLVVSRTINLGSYESVKIEGSVVVGRSDDADTPEVLRQSALDEVMSLIDDARRDHVPASRQKGASDATDPR